jgi:hypothetical protein
MIEPVSNDIRRAHSRAIKRREQWRKQYALLSVAIRETKSLLNRVNRSNSVDTVAEVQLRSLRMVANFMMLDRADVKWDLKNTAYTYVDRETVKLKQSA